MCLRFGQVKAVGVGGFIKINPCLIISLNILCPLVKVIIELFDALNLCQGGCYYCKGGVGLQGLRTREEDVKHWRCAPVCLTIRRRITLLQDTEQISFTYSSILHLAFSYRINEIGKIITNLGMTLHNIYIIYIFYF